MARADRPTVTLTSGFPTPFGEGFAWAVPGLVLSVPGLLLVLIVILVQALGASPGSGRPSTDRCLRTSRRATLGRTPGRAGPAARLTPRTRPVHTPRTSRTAGCERDEYPSHVDPEIRRLVRAGTTTTGMAPAASGPNARRRSRGRQ